jgi:hypothetical protein
LILFKNRHFQAFLSVSTQKIKKPTEKSQKKSGQMVIMRQLEQKIATADRICHFFVI